MTYNEFIQNILDTRGRFGITEDYKERHHIVPECCGGETIEENLIDLTAKEHYEAHKLLAEENPDNISLTYAYWRMSNIKQDDGQHYILTPEEYEEARKFFSTKQRNRSPEEKQLNKEKISYAWEIKSDEELTRIRESKSKNLKLYWESKSKDEVEAWGRSCSDRLLKNHPMKGKHFSEQARKNMGDSHRGNTNRRGKKDSLETRIKKSNVTKDDNNPRAIAIRCVETGEIFGCIKFANERYNIKVGLINKCCKGLLETAGGYHWEYVDK